MYILRQQCYGNGEGDARAVFVEQEAFSVDSQTMMIGCQRRGKVELLVNRAGNQVRS